ncbi:MAG TPA: pyrroloquinoline quinone-dependent dehydrogenase [Candidatus Binataceae bacterium]|nr:pyrroloquinoline quinone-dependent dehydrogenase [Candidatus Binataceae bacterium]
MRRVALVIAFAVVLIATNVPLDLAAAEADQVGQLPASKTNVEWPYYGGDAGAQRFSPLVHINRKNASQLKVAWVYHTGDISNGGKDISKSGFENTPIVVDGKMYISTPFCRVIALDPETGRELWSYDPQIKKDTIYSEGFINRGVSTWLDPARKPGDPCRRRIFIGTIDARLIALDADSGKLCSDFGAGGQINLKTVKNIEHIGYYGEYEETSPPAIIDDLAIVGSGIGDNRALNEPLGTVRAFDARSGKQRWAWNPIPQGPEDPAWKDWKPEDALATGAANVWPPISVDPESDLVFLPVGSASPDYYGGFRRGSAPYSDSLVVLHAKTGQLAWYFQTTHHDLWDYDNPSQPLLCTIAKNGKFIPAVVQGTKRGELFIFNRLTGEPLFPIVEKPVPQSDVPGEETSPTQPFPELPPPLVPQTITANDAFGEIYFDRQSCRERMEKLRAEGTFTPPSLQGSLIVPGNTGGMNWSGAAFDQRRQWLVANVNNLVAEVHLIARADLQTSMNNSRGFGLEFAPQLGTPYGMSRVFMRSKFPGFPCNPPPWGSLVAVDLVSGQIKWSVPLGDIGAVVRESLHLPLPDLHYGAPSLGGAIVTAGDLVFIAGALGDPHLRAFDIETGKMLWTGDLPAAGNATPMTYQLAGGRQYVVIAAGGHSKFDSRRSDSLVAFALPE